MITPVASPLVTRESTRIHNKDSEPEAQVRLLKFPEELDISEAEIQIMPSINLRKSSASFSTSAVDCRM